MSSPKLVSPQIVAKLQIVLDAIIREMDYQNFKWGTLEEHPHTLTEWLLIIESELAETKQAWVKGNGDMDAKRELLQVASVCIAALMQCGVNEREGLVEYFRKYDLSHRGQNEYSTKRTEARRRIRAYKRATYQDGRYTGKDIPQIPLTSDIEVSGDTSIHPIRLGADMVEAIMARQKEVEVAGDPASEDGDKTLWNLIDRDKVIQSAKDTARAYAMRHEMMKHFIDGMARGEKGMVTGYSEEAITDVRELAKLKPATWVHLGFTHAESVAGWVEGVFQIDTIKTRQDADGTIAEALVRLSNLPRNATVTIDSNVKFVARQTLPSNRDFTSDYDTLRQLPVGSIIELIRIGEGFAPRGEAHYKVVRHEPKWTWVKGGGGVRWRITPHTNFYLQAVISMPVTTDKVYTHWKELAELPIGTTLWLDSHQHPAFELTFNKSTLFKVSSVVRGHAPTGYVIISTADSGWYQIELDEDSIFEARLHREGESPPKYYSIRNEPNIGADEWYNVWWGDSPHLRDGYTFVKKGNSDRYYVRDPRNINTPLPLLRFDEITRLPNGAAITIRWNTANRERYTHLPTVGNYILAIGSTPGKYWAKSAIGQFVFLDPAEIGMEAHQVNIWRTPAMRPVVVDNGRTEYLLSADEVDALPHRTLVRYSSRERDARDGIIHRSPDGTVAICDTDTYRIVDGVSRVGTIRDIASGLLRVWVTT